MAAATTYYAITAEQRLAEAQRTLDRHITSSATGRCTECGRLGPCPDREAAALVFFGSLRLPRRRPGTTQPELITARRVA
jgi:hypothetical protein